MTDEQRAAIMQATAGKFVAEADAKFNGNTTLTNEQMACEMYGTIAGAFAVLSAAGVPWKNIVDITSDLVAQMRGEPT